MDIKSMSVVIDDWRQFNADYTFTTGEEALTRITHWIKEHPETKIEINHLYMDYDLGHGVSGVYTLGQLFDLQDENDNFDIKTVEVVSTHPTGSNKLKELLKAKGFKAVTTRIFTSEHDDV